MDLAIIYKYIIIYQFIDAVINDTFFCKKNLQK